MSQTRQKCESFVHLETRAPRLWASVVNAVVPYIISDRGPLREKPPPPTPRNAGPWPWASCLAKTRLHISPERSTVRGPHFLCPLTFSPPLLCIYFYVPSSSSPPISSSHLYPLCSRCLWACLSSACKVLEVLPKA